MIHKRLEQSTGVNQSKLNKWV